MVVRMVLVDGIHSVMAALVTFSSAFDGLVVATGGIGFSPGDLTPEATSAAVERPAPGLVEAMRGVNPWGGCRAEWLGRLEG
jgi:molybdopterin biosynthesis enzyme MoaB